MNANTAVFLTKKLPPHGGLKRLVFSGTQMSSGLSVYPSCGIFIPKLWLSTFRGGRLVQDLLIPEVTAAHGLDTIAHSSMDLSGEGPFVKTSSVSARGGWADECWDSVRRRLPSASGEFPIGLVCVDEIHFIGDAQRGHLLEMLLAKLLFINQVLRRPVQLVGMSATLPNAQQVSLQTPLGLVFKTSERVADVRSQPF